MSQDNVGLMGALLLTQLKEECEQQHARVEAAEQRLAEVEAERDKWKDAVIDALVVDWCLNEETVNDPHKAIAALIEWNIKIHDDPAVSKSAYDRAMELASLKAEQERLREALKATTLQAAKQAEQIADKDRKLSEMTEMYSEAARDAEAAEQRLAEVEAERDKLETQVEARDESIALAKRLYDALKAERDR
jgi:DNA repair exonuclease SbcCD ATPase subunit